MQNAIESIYAHSSSVEDILAITVDLGNPDIAELYRCARDNIMSNVDLFKLYFLGLTRCEFTDTLLTVQPQDVLKMARRTDGGIDAAVIQVRRVSEQEVMRLGLRFQTQMNGARDLVFYFSLELVHQPSSTVSAFTDLLKVEYTDRGPIVSTPNLEPLDGPGQPRSNEILNALLSGTRIQVLYSSG
jgi:hypothetical protein